MNFSANVSWNPNATTIVSNTYTGSQAHNIFISTNNSVYLTATSFSYVFMWYEGNSSLVKSMSGEASARGLFVTCNGDVYVEYSNTSILYRVDKWNSNATKSVPVTYTTSGCCGLFIDNNNTLYCSQDTGNQVVKTSLCSNSNATIIVAGNGTQGSGSYMLFGPNGIFVDQNFTLYVADCYNNRIQRFIVGQLNGTTIAGNGTNGTISLYQPTAIILDANGYLYITDYGNSRIVASGPTGFRCIVGCSGSSGNATSQLSSPRSIAFDSHGNLFVVDTGNKRVQKFFLASNSSGKSKHI